ncbi:MAG: hypothetical protein ACJ8AO_16980 [Gemmatimonadaceae bacterium]
MIRNHLITGAVAIAIAVIRTPVAAQGHDRPHLHDNGKWDECSIQLSPTLTQGAWRQFTQEAGLVAYFRPLADAQPLGRGRFEISVVQWETAIDDADAAWNDTFVHPDSAHYLFEGSGLKFPGLMLRAGISAETDVGLYLTKNPNANYGFFGGQLQRRLVGGEDRRWDASARVSFVSLYGPEDADLTVYGMDLVASRKLTPMRWVQVSPYAGVSGYLSTSHEKTAAVALDDERVAGGQAMAGAVLQLSKARVAAEYNAAKVRTISLKVGFGM